jgi:TrmH family RNA methyltransferase
MGLPTAARAKSERLESRENRWLKRFRAALRDGPEDGAGAVGLEGPRLVAEALRSGLEIAGLLVADSGERHLARLKPLLPADLHVLRTTDRLFASVADTETPQGIAVLVEPRRWSWDDLMGATPLVVVLAGVQDPGNVGTIVRTAEALGSSGLVACRGCAHPLGPKAVRASAGSVLRLPALAGEPAERVVEELRGRGVRQHAATLAAGQTPEATNLAGPCAIWIGGEGAGLPAEIARGADARVQIPLRAPVDSLNAAAAAAVLLYEAARQRGHSLAAQRVPEEGGEPRRAGAPNGR